MNIGMPGKKVIGVEDPAPAQPREIPAENPQPRKEQPVPIAPSKTKEEVRVS